jgi:predicted TIM-barrel fold metal-dependent hydrolase
MCASLLPIAKLARAFQQLNGAYLDVVSARSASEKQKLFSDTAIDVYRLEKN